MDLGLVRGHIVQAVIKTNSLVYLLLLLMLDRTDSMLHVIRV